MRTAQPVLDWEFIREHTHGFETFADAVRAADWAALERRSGLTRNAMEAAALVYSRANAVIGIYGMGLTQHVKGVGTVQMLVNLLLLRGNIGQAGRRHLSGARPFQRAGPAHRRHHREARTGAARSTRRAVWLRPPREEGLNTVTACEAMLAARSTPSSAWAATSFAPYRNARRWRRRGGGCS